MSLPDWDATITQLPGPRMVTAPSGDTEQTDGDPLPKVTVPPGAAAFTVKLV